LKLIGNGKKESERTKARKEGKGRESRRKKEGGRRKKERYVIPPHKSLGVVKGGKESSESDFDLHCLQAGFQGAGCRLQRILLPFVPFVLLNFLAFVLSFFLLRSPLLSSASSFFLLLSSSFCSGGFLVGCCCCCYTIEKKIEQKDKRKIQVK